MTLQTPPAYLQAGTYSALSDRLHLITAVTQRASPSGHAARQGFYADRFPAYSNPSGMNWTVGFCAGVIANTFTADGGDYRFVNPSNVTGSFAASSPTQNRYDILGFQVKDNFYDSSGLNSVIPAVIQGTNSSGTPVDPALPASFIPIVRAVINAGVTSPTLQSMIVKTVPSMAILPILNNTERTALGTMPIGFTIWNIASQRHEVADGAGGWSVLPGAADVDLVGGEYRATAAQTFPGWAANKLTFGTAMFPATGITWNGTNQFTVTRSDVYSMKCYARVPFASGNDALIGIGRATLSGSGITGELYSGWYPVSKTDGAAATTRFMFAGDQICAWMYVNGGSAGAPLPSGTDASNLGEFAVWKDR